MTPAFAFHPARMLQNACLLFWMLARSLSSAIAGNPDAVRSQQLDKLIKAESPQLTHDTAFHAVPMLISDCLT